MCKFQKAYIVKDFLLLLLKYLMIVLIVLIGFLDSKPLKSNFFLTSGYTKYISVQS